ncbi:MAG: hypothetical protein AAF570_26220, partial [Bacteroidota bacterium]
MGPTFSTSIQLNRNRIHYRIEKKWIEFPISQIQLIGEYAAPPGVLAADYFFSFKLRDIEETVDVPAYTEGLFDEVLPGLKKLLPGVRGPRLQMETEFASNVLYPAHVAGMKMFAFQSEIKPLI